MPFDALSKSFDAKSAVRDDMAEIDVAARRATARPAMCGKLAAKRIQLRTAAWRSR
jgi:hypothetical protein